MKFGEYTLSMNPVYADIEIEEIIKKHGGLSFGEIKEDGYRCQIHADGGNIKMFTRNNNEYVYECYPEIVEAVKKLNLKQTVLDAEIKGESIGYVGYQQMRNRFRKTQPKKKDIEKYEKLIQQIPLKLVIFDILMFEGKQFLNKELSYRRLYTEKIFGTRINPSDLYKITTQLQFDQLFQEKVKKQRHEGFVLKNPSSHYIGKPKELYQKDEYYHWVKIKNFETLDLVIVALLKSEAEYAKELKFSSALCAARNQETNMYEAMGSISLVRKNPLTNNPFASDLEKIIKKTSSQKPRNIFIPEKIEKKYNNALYVKPENSQVIQVKTMNIEFDGKNYAFRIAHINDIREDKNVSQATTLKEIQNLYKIQKGDKINH